MGITTYMSMQAKNQQAKDDNAFYKRQAELKQQQYMFGLERMREQRLKVGKAGAVEAEKFSDAMLDQRIQRIEAIGKAKVRSGEGTGDINSILLGINRQGLTNINRIQSQFGTTTQNLRGELNNIAFQAKDLQHRTQAGIEATRKSKGPSFNTQLAGYAESSARAYQFNKDAGLEWGSTASKVPKNPSTYSSPMAQYKNMGRTPSNKFFSNQAYL